MSYIIYFNDNLEKRFKKGIWVNRTWQAVAGNERALVQLYDLTGMGGKHFSKLSFGEKLMIARQPDALSELSKLFRPVGNYVHLLQLRPSYDVIWELYHKARSLVVIQEGFNTYLGVTRSSALLTEQLAYAYMRIDNSVPEGFKFRKGYGLRSAKEHWLQDDDYAKLLDFIRAKRLEKLDESQARRYQAV